jgi:hypothetical protein
MAEALGKAVVLVVLVVMAEMVETLGAQILAANSPNIEKN